MKWQITIRGDSLILANTGFGKTQAPQLDRPKLDRSLENRSATISPASVMARPKKPKFSDSLPPEERVLQVKTQITREESLAQAQKMFVRLIVGGLAIGIISAIVIVQFMYWLDRTFNTRFAPTGSPGQHRNR